VQGLLHPQALALPVPQNAGLNHFANASNIEDSVGYLEAALRGKFIPGLRMRAICTALLWEAWSPTMGLAMPSLPNIQKFIHLSMLVEKERDNSLLQADSIFLEMGRLPLENTHFLMATAEGHGGICSLSWYVCWGAEQRLASICPCHWAA
jgi:hypothetical protein